MKKFSKQHKRRVAVGLSGGVDSAVAAHLLLEQGFDVTGVYMQCWDARADGCKSEEDRAYAVANAAKLGIKFKHLDFRVQYKNLVMRSFYKEYENGRTPNPDVMCNKEIKFGLFFDWAVKSGFDYVATGHYAKIVLNSTADYALSIPKDVTKDQTYFLYLLTQPKLSKILFPLGDYKKTAIRNLAKKLNLPSAERPESMGICFIGEVNIKEFISKTIKPKQGDVVNLQGTTIGKHDGVWLYTIGQRHGFSVTEYTGEPLYVVAKDIKTNLLIVGSRDAARTMEFNVSQVHWIAHPPQADSHISCDVRIRHLGELIPVNIKTTEDGLVKVNTKTPIFGVTPGQSAVFYNNAVVLGGGIID